MATSILLMLVITASLLEIGSFLAVRYFIFPRDSAAFFVPQYPARTDFEQYMKQRDAVLGWPSPGALSGDKHDASGARPSPVFPKPGRECVVLFGDSYTYGDEVSDEDAWGNVLAELLGCRVGNFGVGGYGTDQALLRYLQIRHASAKVAVLGIFPDNVLRNVNQYRYFLTGGSLFGLKPRFVLDAGKLRTIPIPEFSYESFLEAIRQPHDFYQYETFLPGSTEGPVPVRFPYSLAMYRYATSYRVRNWLRGRPSWSDFVSPGHASQSMEITAAIARRFAEVAAERAQQPIVLLYPTASSYQQYQETGKVAYQPLLDRLAEARIQYLDLHDPLRQLLAGVSLCEILTRPGHCTGHFNSRGNRLVADAVFRYLQKAGWVRSPVQTPAREAQGISGDKASVRAGN